MLQAVTIALVGVVSLGVVILTTSAFAEPGDNLPPIAAPDFAATEQDTPVVIDVLANDSDPDGGTLLIAPDAIARASILSAGPILFWECYPAGGGLVTDLSGLGNHGNIGPGVTPGDPDGDCGGSHAFQFPGDPSAVVSAEAPIAPQGAAPRSVLVRFQADMELAGGVGIFSMGTNEVGNAQFSLTRDWNNSQVTFAAWGNDVVVPLPAGANLADGLEHTLVLTYDGTTTLTAYLDGVPGAPASIHAPLETLGSTVMLGQTLYGALGGNDQLRQFAVFPVALAPETIASVHSAIQAGAQGMPVTQPANGVAASDGSMITYVPNPGFSGTDAFTYSITDGQGGTASAVVTVTVSAGITAAPDHVTVATGGALTFDPTANDTIPEGVSASVTVVSVPENGQASILEDGRTLQYVPDEGFIGTDTFQYTLETDEGVLRFAIVTVTVTPANTSPVAVDDSAVTSLGAPVHIDVIANDSDPEGQAVYISPGQLARGAILRAGPLLHWECLPEGGAAVLGDTSGNNRDGVVGAGVGMGAETGDCDNGTAMVFAGPDGVVSLANPGLPSGQQPRAALVRYKANTTSAPADIPLFGYGKNGEPFSQFSVSRTVLGNDKLIFTSWANDLHFDLPPGANVGDGNEHNIMFVYDGDLTVYAYYDGIPSGQGTLHTPLTTVDDTVMLGQSPWGWQSAGDEMRQFAIFPTAISEDDAYLVHAAIQAAVLNQSHTVPRFGSVVEDPDHLGFTYTPDPGFTGSDQFYYSISDGHGGGAIALVSIEVTAGVAANDDHAETDADTPVVIEVLANDSAQEGAALSINSVTQPEHGAAVVDGATIVYTPEEGFQGVDSFQYTVSSDQGGDGVATVVVVVGDSGENLPPVAVDDAAGTTAGAPVEIDVLANDSDPDGDPLVIAAGESAIPAVQGYAPVLYWACLADGAATVFDQSGNGRDGAVNGSVAAGPAAADCGGGTAMSFPDGTASISRATPGLPEGSAARSVMMRYRSDFAGPGDVGLMGMGTNAIGLGQFSLSRTGSGNDRLVFASWGNDAVLPMPAGTDIADGGEHTIVVVYDGDTTLTAYVDGVAGTPVTVAPLATVDGAVVLGQTLYGAISVGAEMRHFAVFDRALTGGEVSGLHDAIEGISGGAGFTQPANGTVVATMGGLTYTPAPGFTGVDTFTYGISDGNGGSDTATVTVTVHGAFNVEDDSAEVIGTEPTLIDVLANDTAAPGFPLVIDSVTQGAHGSVSIVDGAVLYIAAEGYSGPDEFTYTAVDEDENSGTATVYVTVISDVNTPPEAQDDQAESEDGGPVVIDVLANDTDADGDPLRVSSGAGARSTIASLNPVIFWECLAPGAGAVQDLGNFSNTGTLMGSATAGAASGDCDGGASVRFPDHTAAVQASNPNLPAGNAARSVMLRFKANYAGPGDIGLFGYGTNAVGLGQFSVARTGLGNDRLVFASWGNDAVLALPGGVDLGDGLEHTIVIVYDGGSVLTPYVDGVPGTPAVIAPLNTVDGVVVLGQTVYGGAQAGDEMRQFAIFEGALSDGQILALHQGLNAAAAASALTQPANGAATTDGLTVTYTPNAGFSGVDTFTYQVSDGRGGTDVATVTVTVQEGEFAPQDDTAFTQQGQPVTVPVLDNDSGPDLVVDAVTQGANGSVTTDGETVEYTPEPGFHGVDTFEVTVVSGEVALTSTVTVTVNGRPVGGDLATGTDIDTAVTVDVLSTVSDPEGTDLAITSTSSPANGSVAIESGQVVYTPDAGFIGGDSFTVTVADEDGGTVTITVTVTVGQLATADDEASTQQDQAVVIDVLANDVGSGLYVQSAGAASNGTTSTDGATVTYTPDAGFFGTDSFQVTVSQGAGADPETWQTGIVTVTVNGAPVGDDIEAEADLETPVVIDILAAVTDPEEGTLSITGTTDPSNGTISVDGGLVTYTPAPGFTGADSFTVTVADPDGGVLTITVTVDVAGNLPPVTVDDEASAVSGVPTSIDVLGNDSDPDGDALTLHSAVGVLRSLTPDLYWACLPSSGLLVQDQSGNGQHGVIQGNVLSGGTAGDCGGATPVFADGSALILNATGSILPSGSDARTMVVRFRTDLAEPSNVGLFGYGTNAQPLGQFSIARTSAGNDRLIFASWGNDNLLHLPAGTDIADGLEHTIVVTYDGASTLVAWVDGVAGTPTTIAPLDTQVGQVMLGQTLYGAVSAGSEMRHFAIYNGVLDGADIAHIHASIEAGDTLTFEQPANGAVVRDGDQVVYTSMPGFTGTDSFTYVASDGNGGTAQATVTVTVTAPALVAEDDTAFTQQGATVTIPVLDNDTGDDLMVDSVTQGGNGTTWSDGEVVQYTPEPGFWGTDMFEVTVSDGFTTATSTVTVTVNGAPVGGDLAEQTDRGAAAVIDVLGTVADPEGGDVAITAVTAPAHGSVVVDGGTVTYTPDEGFSGLDTFEVTVTDEDGGTLVILVTVEVENRAPQGDDLQALTQQDQSVVLEVLATVTDPDGDTLSIASVSTPASGSAVIAGSAVEYTPDAGFHGVDSFDVTVEDGHGGELTLTITVAVNGAPVASDIDAGVTQPETPLAVDVLSTVTDPEGGALEITGAGPASGGSVTIEAGGVVYTPAPGFTGPDAFQVTVVDGDGGSVTITVTVHVNSLPTAPAGLAAATGFEEAVSVDVLGAVTDADGDDLAIVEVTEPVNGSATIVGGSVTYTPHAGFAGSDSFTVTVEDEHGGSVTLILTIEVAPNTAPVGNDVQAATQQDTPVGIDILGGFTDAEGDAMAIADVETPANGSAAVDGGSITYTPDAGFAGIEVFQVTVADEHGFETTITVSILVNGAPQGADVTTHTSEDAPVDIDVLAGIMDPNGDAVELVQVSDPANGSVTVVNGVVTYTPDAGFVGDDVFNATFQDGNGGSLTIAVTVTVASAPRIVLTQNACIVVVARGGEATYLSEFWLQAPGTPSFLGITSQSPDGTMVPLGAYAAGTEVVLSIHVTSTGHVFSTGVAANNPDGMVHATLTAGADDVLYTVAFEDQFNGGDQDFNDAVLDVLALDCAVTAQDDSVGTPEGSAATVAVLDNDSTMHGTLAITSVTDGAHGAVTTDGETVTYTPDAGFAGSDAFTYTVENGLGGVATATVSVQVAPAPRVILAQQACIALVVQPASAEFTNEFWLESPDTPVFLGITNADSGARVALGTFLEGTELVFSIRVTESGLTFRTGPASGNPDGLVHVNLDTGLAGILYRVGFEDLYGGGDLDFDDAVFDLVNINCDVQASDDRATTDKGNAVVIDVLANDDSEEGTLEVTSVTQGAHGSVATDGDTVTYTPASGFTGTDTFTYTAENGLGGSAMAQVEVTVKSASITVGKMTGGGNFQKDGHKANWGMELRCSGGGHFNFHDDTIRLHVNNMTFDSLDCLNDPDIHNGKTFDTVVLVGHGPAQLGNSNVDVIVEATLTDGGGNKSSDTITITVTTTSGSVVTQFSGSLSGGNHVAHNK
ncbi:MAG: Ig-like domain-containing protein [Dehalococcoidia bacterium]|nr:Ig-like domain-containing protein [Dehalococcoidia bacterium]